MINVLALLVLVSAGSRVWEQFSGPGELTVTKLNVVAAEGKQLVRLGANMYGNGSDLPPLVCPHPELGCGY